MWVFNSLQLTLQGFWQLTHWSKAYLLPAFFATISVVKYKDRLDQNTLQLLYFSWFGIKLLMFVSINIQH